MKSSNFLFKRETSSTVKIQKLLFYYFIFSIRHNETKIAMGGVSFVRVCFLCKSLLA